MRIAITGASGLLGRELLRQVCDRHDTVAAVHIEGIEIAGRYERLTFDLTDRSSIHAFIQRARADIIVHCAAITDVDRCELEADLAQRLNADGTRYIADAVDRFGGRLLFISTDFVFDGKDGPYSEEGITNPVNVYGKTKLEGEAAVAGLGDRGVIVRSASFLGVGSSPRTSFAERMVHQLRTNLPFPAAVDQISNVTPIDELASGIIRVIESGVDGIWHIASPELVSRFDLALMLARLLNTDPSIIQKTDYESLQRLARRPLRGGLKVDKSRQQLALVYRSLSDSLAHFVSLVSER